jgi:hypothetical protein
MRTLEASASVKQTEALISCGSQMIGVLVYVKEVLVGFFLCS